MIDFYCPVCKRSYHADESQIGKNIRCNTPGCEEIITIAWQDGRYTSSGKQLRIADKWRFRSLRAYCDWRKLRQFRNIKRSRLYLFVGAVVLLMAILFSGYWFGMRMQASDQSKKDSKVGLGFVSLASSPQPQAVPKPKANVFDDLKEEPNTNESNSVSNQTPIIRWDEETAMPINSKPVSRQGEKTKAAKVQQSSLPANSLPTGTRLIEDQATSGSGLLKAINGTALDSFVVVMLADTSVRVRVVSIQAHDSSTLEHFSPGEYKVLFATGMDWDSNKEEFNREGSYYEFGKNLTFDEDNNSYVRETITLNAVFNGNVRARSISKDEFHRLTGKH
jgi:hypothetical protein